MRFQPTTNASRKTWSSVPGTTGPGKNPVTQSLKKNVKVPTSLAEALPPKKAPMASAAPEA